MTFARWLSRCGLVVAATLSCALNAVAGGPRWYTGAPFYTAPPGNPVVFFTSDPLYYTDPGDLNANVTHAQADAMVAAAAAVWNAPTSRLTLAKGGTLAEHVSSANVYFDGTNMVFPDDVMLANYHSKPIAIIYDTDGSVIDTLLGSGASSPSGCRQNGVVESVDGLDPAGTIDHALLILNGRCVGSAPDQLTQMQYQLMRAFGRVIGLAWAQLNENVFTGSPAPTFLQIQHWPVMHPIDVVCGPYTFKCMVSPFTLRADDLSSLARLYPVTADNITAGKTLSATGTLSLAGIMQFPTGQGMDGINVTVSRALPFSGTPDTYEVASGVTGDMHQQFYGNPVMGPAEGPAQSSGAIDPIWKGWYWMQRVPIDGIYGWETIYVRSEPINPLYSGEYAIAPYFGAPIVPSGAPVTLVGGLAPAGHTVYESATITDAASSCNTGNDGQENAPAAADPSGLWSGLLCSNNHTSWVSQSVKAGHSWSLETTAVDEAGIGSSGKARILLGVWNAADPTGTLPTVAATPSAQNGRVVGMTQLHMDATSSAQTYRIAIADQRGHGRPDFAYTARLLYADSISPVQVGASGGRVTITGQGFRRGNTVNINGVAAKVLSWSATQIVAVAPTRSAAHMSATGSADVAVVDATTGGSTVIQGALSYGGVGVNAIVLVSAPALVETGIASSIPFAVRVFETDGVTAVAGATVQVVATGAAATFAGCGASSCLLTTDASGLAQSVFTAVSAGTVTLTATEQSGGAAVQATVNVVDPVRVVSSTTAPRYVAAGAAVRWTVAVGATQDGVAAAGQTVAWTAGNGANLGAVSGTTDAGGAAVVSVSTTGLSGGTQAVVQGCVWVTVCAGSSVFGIDPSQWTVAVVSGAGQSLQASLTLLPVVLQVNDLAGHALQGATVTVYQTVDGWEGFCPARGRCAAAPVLASSQKMMTTDANGAISVTPLEVAGVASVVHVAAVTGTQGFASLSLTKTP